MPADWAKLAAAKDGIAAALAEGDTAYNLELSGMWVAALGGPAGCALGLGPCLDSEGSGGVKIQAPCAGAT